MASEPLKLLSLSKTAELLGVAGQTVRNLVERGELLPAATVIGEKRTAFFFRPSDVSAVLRRKQAALTARQVEVRRHER